eukprot:9947245-Alexandrium_andersonii.AAC.1
MLELRLELTARAAAAPGPVWPARPAWPDRVRTLNTPMLRPELGAPVPAAPVHGGENPRLRPTPRRAPCSTGDFAERRPARGSGRATSGSPD